MAIKTVIFDLDGTITMPFFDFDKIRLEMGLAADAGPILELLEEMSQNQRNKLESILAKHESIAVEKSKLNKGARYTLELLRNNKINIGILTRNTRSNAEAIAKKHNLIFDAIVDREDGPVKPNAFGVLKLCKHFNSNADETLVVGDYLYDILSAKAAGAYSVLIKNHAKCDEFAKEADFSITSLDEIPQIIDNINNGQSNEI